MRLELFAMHKLFFPLSTFHTIMEVLVEMDGRDMTSLSALFSRLKMHFSEGATGCHCCNTQVEVNVWLLENVE